MITCPIHNTPLVPDYDGEYLRCQQFTCSRRHYEPQKEDYRPGQYAKTDMVEVTCRVCNKKFWVARKRSVALERGTCPSCVNGIRQRAYRAKYKHYKIVKGAIDKLIEERGISRYKVEMGAGIGTGSLANYARDTLTIRSDIAEKVAKYLRVSLDRIVVMPKEKA